MRRMSLIVVLVVLVGLVTGCAPRTQRGVVAMTMGDKQAQICLGRGEAEIGNELALYRATCEKWPTDTPSSVVCEKKQIGRGEITEIVNEHFSIARLSSSTPVKEGDVVELQR